MILETIGHSYHYELENICRMFFPFEKIRVFSEPSDRADPLCCMTRLEQRENGVALSVGVTLEQDGAQGEDFVAPDDPHLSEECERRLAVLLFDCLSRLTGYRPSWGVLTGVRPAKLMRHLVRTEGRTAAIRHFTDQLLVLPEKAALCRQVGEREDAIAGLSRRNSFSLYIAIPFCPTRCSYCSFVSHSVEKSRKLVPDYVDLLCQEIAETGRIAWELGLRCESVYFGGGTPTTLTAGQLTRILNTVAESFLLDTVREYTVEAGRPDTITPDRLEALLRGGVTRISINPQSMNDEVLREIGRRHTAEDTRRAYALAREMGFSNINMDLIAGLPLDTPAGFSATLDEILALAPESVTVHTLAMKRASRLTVSGERQLLQRGAEVSAMLSEAGRRLTDAGLLPYYMYRQSKTVGNLENVGYARPGKECLYNVFIMEETHTILGCGASAVTKLREPGKNHIERIFNYKYPYEYNTRFSEIQKRKAGVKGFYEAYVGTFTSAQDHQ